MKQLLGQLQTETFVFDLGADLLPDFSLDDFAFRRLDAHTIEVDVSREYPVNDVFAQFSRQGIQVLSMRNKSNRLEEMFVSLLTQEAAQ